MPLSIAACCDINESLPFSEGGKEEGMVCQYAKHYFYMSFPVSEADLIQFWHTVLSSVPPSENGKLSFISQAASALLFNLGWLND